MSDYRTSDCSADAATGCCVLSFTGRVLRGAASLLSGMGLTFSYFINPKTVVTQQYPDNRSSLQMLQRFRGKVVMPHLNDNTHNCTGCGICETACPNGTISILTRKNEETKKKELDRFVYRFETCIICNHCIEACPFDAIAMSNDFETAVYDRRELVQQLNQAGSRLAASDDKAAKEEQ